MIWSQEVLVKTQLRNKQNSIIIIEMIIFIDLPTGSEFWDNSQHRQIRLIPNNSVREIHTSKI